VPRLRRCSPSLTPRLCSLRLRSGAVSNVELLASLPSADSGTLSKVEGSEVKVKGVFRTQGSGKAAIFFVPLSRRGSQLARMSAAERSNCPKGR
jgi:hypothetical protein